MNPLRPQDIEFFDGERELGTLVLEGHPANGKTRCTHTIRWEHLMSRTVACGNSIVFTIEKKRGIKVEERSDLEAALKASLGVQFLTKLDATFKAKLGSTMTIESVLTEKEESQYKAKDCYQNTIDVYQLQSRVRLEIEWQPLFGKKKYWETDIHINHPKIHQEPKAVPRHLDCGCPDSAGEKLDYLQVRTPHLTVIEPYIVHNRQLYFFNLGLYVDDGQVVITPEGATPPWPPSANLPRDWGVDLDDVDERSTEALEQAEGEIPARVFPRYLRFLTDMDDDDVTVVRFSKPERGTIQTPLPV